MRTSWMLGGLLLANLAGAAEVDRFQIWSTLGASSGAAHGEKLLEVQNTKGGSLIRYIYAGLGDVGCGRTTVLVWEKQLTGISPERLARPANLCKVTPKGLSRVAARHKPWFEGTENDSSVLVTQCGTVKQAVSLDYRFEDLGPEDADFRFFDALWTLQSRVLEAAWGEHPPAFVVEPDAQREGEKFVALARREHYDQQDPLPLPSFPEVLEQYRGPIPQPQFRWTVDLPPGVRLTRFVEPLQMLSAFDAGVRSYGIELRLTVDPNSGKVTNVEAARNAFDMRTNLAWSASQNWIFDPATVPNAGVVPVTVRFQAECGEGR